MKNIRKYKEKQLKTILKYKNIERQDTTYTYYDRNTVDRSVATA